MGLSLFFFSGDYRACILRFLIFIEHMFKVQSSKKFQKNWRRDLYSNGTRFLEQWNHTYHAYYLVSIVVDREIALEQRVVRRRPRKESATKAERSGSNDAVTYLRSRFTIFCTNPQTKTSNFMILCKTHKPWLDDYKVEETKV